MNAKEKTEHFNPKASAVSGSELLMQTAAVSEADETEIDLLDLAYYFLDKLHYIVFFALLGAVLLNAYSFFAIPPTYESVAKMYVVSASDDSVVDLTDLNIGTSLTADYEELMLSYPVLDQVIDRLDLECTYTELAKMITIENPADTRILAVRVTTTSPELSRDIANTMTTVSVNYLPRTMGTEQPNIAQEARAALVKSAPSYIKYTIIGALLGILLCCAYFTVRYLLDDTIHTEEDMEKYFGLTPLATIPDVLSVEQEKNRRKFLIGGKE